MSAEHDAVAGDTADPEVLSIELPHLRVSALAWGPSDGPLALCLHGYPDTAWTWRQLGPILASHGYRVVAPFSRGYSPTAIPRDGDYHIGALMYDAIELHRQLGGGNDALLIGHDWGGFTAAGLAAYPDSPFQKVAVLAIPLLYGFRGAARRGTLRFMPSQVRKSWYVVYQQLPLSERTVERVIPKLWRDWCPPGYDVGPELDRLWASLPDVAHRKAAVSYYRFQFQPRKQPPQYAELHRYWQNEPLQIPTLLVHGGLDGGLDIGMASLSASGLPPGSTHHIIPGAGHFPQLDSPDEVSRLTLQYAAQR